MTTLTRQWNARSGITHCSTCDGTGEVWNGRGCGGNDPDSWNVPCPDCDEPVEACLVCGFDVEVPGYDCLACHVVTELASDQLTPAVAHKFHTAILEAMQERRAGEGEG